MRVRGSMEVPAGPLSGALGTERSQEPIFVVGVSRSGTTLLAAMLNGHSRISCGPETFFFPRLASQQVDRLLGDARWPTRATAFLTSIRLAGSDLLVHELFDRSQAEIAADLAKLPRQVPSLLEALAGARARAEGKPRWAEKTPNHLLHLADIRRYYPTAPIVRIVRDPRDVALSLANVPFGSQSKLANLYLWLERDERSWRFFESDRHSVTVKYEQLLANPSGELAKVCALVGEPFEDRMLQGGSADGLVTSIEWWKQRTRGPLDASRAGRWRQHYSDAEAAAARLICHDGLARYGYEAPISEPPTVYVHPLTKAFVERNERVPIELARVGVRAEPWVWRRSGLSRAAADAPSLFWGLPGELRWQLGPTLGRRIASTFDLVGWLTRAVVHGRRPVWVREPSGLPAAAGLAEQACSRLLHVAALSRSADGALQELVPGSCR